MTRTEITREIARLGAALRDERNFYVHPGDDADPEGDVRSQIADLYDELSDLEQTRIEGIA